MFDRYKPSIIEGLLLYDVADGKLCKILNFPQFRVVYYANEMQME